MATPVPLRRMICAKALPCSSTWPVSISVNACDVISSLGALSITLYIGCFSAGTFPPLVRCNIMHGIRPMDSEISR